jgi:hypothetical protein
LTLTDRDTVLFLHRSSDGAGSETLGRQHLHVRQRCLLHRIGFQLRSPAGADLAEPKRR